MRLRVALHDLYKDEWRNGEAYFAIVDLLEHPPREKVYIRGRYLFRISQRIAKGKKLWGLEKGRRLRWRQDSPLYLASVEIEKEEDLGHNLVRWLAAMSLLRPAGVKHFEAVDVGQTMDAIVKAAGVEDVRVRQCSARWKRRSPDHVWAMDFYVMGSWMTWGHARSFDAILSRAAAVAAGLIQVEAK